MERVRTKHKLLDTLIAELPARNDAHIAKKVGWKQGFVSKLRHGHVGFTSKRILELHDATGWSIKRIKGLL